MTRRSTVVGRAPSVAATTSYRCPAVRSAPSRLTTRNGSATKVWAMHDGGGGERDLDPEHLQRLARAGPAGRTCRAGRCRRRRAAAPAAAGPASAAAPGPESASWPAPAPWARRRGCTASVLVADVRRLSASAAGGRVGGDQGEEVAPVDAGHDRGEREHHEELPPPRPARRPSRGSATGRCPDAMAMAWRIRRRRGWTGPSVPVTRSMNSWARSAFCCPSGWRSGRCSPRRTTRGTRCPGPRRRPPSRR